MKRLRRKKCEFNMMNSPACFFFFFLPFCCLLYCCTPEEEIITYAGNARLTFSEDTISFDTIFTSLGSTTHWLTVHNPNRNAVEIDAIELAGGASSPYTVYVNGKSGNIFTNQFLLGKDSLLVLVEVTIDPADQNMPFLVKDSLIFQTNGNQQDVKLTAWGQDAHFLQALTIRKDTIFTAKRPYVIIDSLFVEAPATLHIEAGARLFFDNQAKLLVQGSLQAKGTAENRIVFKNIRQDAVFANAPGQWGGIIFTPESKQNIVDFAVIRNAENGIFKQGSPQNDNGQDTIPQLVIVNTIIENMSSAGILAFNASLRVYNTLVNHCVGHIIGNFEGGRYSYTHCTLDNGNNLFVREAPVAEFSDGMDEHGTRPMNVRMENNIIWGNLNEELVLDQIALDASVLQITHNLIKTRRNELEANDNLINIDPEYIDPVVYNYRLDTTSQAIDKGAKSRIMTDLDGNQRDTLPDLGAYEFIKE